MDSDISQAFECIYKSSWYIRGKENEAFEKEYVDYFKINYCVGCGNGLNALTLSLKVIGVGVGDEVIVLANSFIATTLVASVIGAKPVFVDCDFETNNIEVI